MIKLGQLDRVVRDHQGGRFTIPGDLASANDPYFPILVMDLPFEWTFLLRNILDRAIARLGLFRGPAVAKPIVCGVDEFEYLVHICERESDLAEVLRGYLLTDRMDSLGQYIYTETGPLFPAACTEGGWDLAREMVRSELFG